MSRYSPAFITMCAIPSASCDVNCAFGLNRYTSTHLPSNCKVKNHSLTMQRLLHFRKGGGGGGGGG